MLTARAHRRALGGKPTLALLPLSAGQTKRPPQSAKGRQDAPPPLPPLTDPPEQSGFFVREGGKGEVKKGDTYFFGHKKAPQKHV
jgi:hypothetical protein